MSDYIKGVKVITYGTFDLFHVGHLRLLKRLRSLGDELYVGLSTDEFNSSKGKKSFFSYEERREILKGCKYVTDVFPEYSWEQKRQDIIQISADIFAMGDDWEGKFDALQDITTVKYLPRTEDVSTTDIKKSLARFKDSDFKQIESNLHEIIEIIKSIQE